MTDTTVLDPEMRTRVDDFIRQRVAEGFASEDRIIEWALDYWEAPPDFYALEAYVVQCTRKALAAHCETQKSWPQETDCNRLDFAFLTLREEHGIVARQNFTCCQSDGHYDIQFDVHEMQKRRPVLGYVFYHEQDTEWVVSSGTLFMAFGAVEDDEKARQTVARRTVAVLQEAGFTVEWNGSAETRIMIKGLDWKKRREDCH
ncbi:MAG: hypothetical protein K8R89_02545 [Anaerolineae bacterium]|nr:hypothetical protein [Anaerolineae bacterium]